MAIFLRTPNALFATSKFSILARGHSSFHVSALEASFIKSLNPLLCKKRIHLPFKNFLIFSLFPLYNQVWFHFCFILTISPEECQTKSFGKKNLLLYTIYNCNCSAYKSENWHLKLLNAVNLGITEYLPI